MILIPGKRSRARRSAVDHEVRAGLPWTRSHGLNPSRICRLIFVLGCISGFGFCESVLKKEGVVLFLCARHLGGQTTGQQRGFRRQEAKVEESSQPSGPGGGAGRGRHMVGCTCVAH